MRIIARSTNTTRKRRAPAHAALVVSAAFSIGGCDNGAKSGASQSGANAQEQKASEPKRSPGPAKANNGGPEGACDPSVANVVIDASKLKAPLTLHAPTLGHEKLVLPSAAPLTINAAPLGAHYVTLHENGALVEEHWRPLIVLPGDRHRVEFDERGVAFNSVSVCDGAALTEVTPRAQMDSRGWEPMVSADGTEFGGVSDYQKSGIVDTYWHTVKAGAPEKRQHIRSGELGTLGTAAHAGTTAYIRERGFKRVPVVKADHVFTYDNEAWVVHDGRLARAPLPDLSEQDATEAACCPWGAEAAYVHGDRVAVYAWKECMFNDDDPVCRDFGHHGDHGSRTLASGALTSQARTTFPEPRKLPPTEVSTLVTPHLLAGEKVVGDVYRGSLGPSSDALLAFVSYEEQGIPRMRALALHRVHGKVRREAVSMGVEHFDSVLELAFPDLDGDGVREVVVVAEFMLGAGPAAGRNMTLSFLLRPHARPMLDQKGTELLGGATTVADALKAYKAGTHKLAAQGGRP